MQADLLHMDYEAVGGCWGLARRVNQAIGRELPLWADICVERSSDEIEKRRHHFDRIEDPQPGDLVLIQTFDGTAHFGVVIEPGVMLQATRKHNVHRMRLDHPWCRDRVRGFYRYKEQSWA